MSWSLLEGLKHVQMMSSSSVAMRERNFAHLSSKAMPITHGHTATYLQVPYSLNRAKTHTVFLCGI
jgi:hypothetical protein